MSLSQWLRRAGLEQLHRSDSDAEWTADDLQQFFDQVDKSEKDKTPEPDWEEHLATIDDSRLSGLPKP
ncbi:MAG: antitoxin [Gammaproteobacteria bacterium]|nr:antitoxin [Gammaproteobacteria bacterium]